jgi:penicillin-binding protein 1A
VLFIVTALLGVFSGVMFAYAGDLPLISELDEYAPSAITRIYAANGETLGEFAIERRLVVPYDDISPHLRQAIISAEDKDFNSHFGLSVSAMLIRLSSDIVRRRMVAGASTLTMQLARGLFAEEIGFTLGDKSPERKIKEILVAIQIEKRYTKREILTLYCNQTYFGHGTHGVEAAARLYFGKRAKDVTIDEAAMLAGIIQTPARQSPFVDRAAATRRRNYALQRMAEDGYISQEQADAFRKKPIVVRGQPQPLRSVAPFFTEEVRKYLEQKYGAKALYEEGLSVHTGVDIRLQRAANRAVDRGLRLVDKRRGYRRDKANVAVQGGDIRTYKNDRWNQPIAEDDVVPAVVMSVSPTAAVVRVGQQSLELRGDAIAWTRRAPPALFKVGDLIDLRVLTVGESAAIGSVVLEQAPLVEGALLAIDNRTGQIRAMVGGFNFDRSKFNRATQARRQVGSLFKPFVYTAAVDRGFTPSSIIVDEPVAYTAGPGQPLYSPKNYDGKYEGGVTLRRALEQSRNVPAVKMMETLGPGTGDRLREAVRTRVGPRTISLAGARRGRPHPARDDVGLLRVSQRWRADETVSHPRHHGSQRQSARGEPAAAAGRHTGRHGLCDDQSPAGCGAAGNSRLLRRSWAGRSAARPARPTTTAMRGSSASIPTSPWACGWATTSASRLATTKPAASRRFRSGSTSCVPISRRAIRRIRQTSCLPATSSSCQ